MDVLSLIHQLTDLSTAQCMVFENNDPEVWCILKEQCERLANDYPLAYLQGYVRINDRSYWVNEQTLIPRVETELWLQKLAKFLPRNQSMQWLECGTGCGWIAIEMSLVTSWSITAMERSSDALKVAQLNSAQHQASVHWLHQSWYDDWSMPLLDGVFANPPYISPNDHHLEGGIRYEPQEALTAKDNGLSDIKEIIHKAASVLKSGGYLVLEHGYDQKLAVQKLLLERGFKGAMTWLDERGNDRMTLASWEIDTMNAWRE